MRFIKLFLSIIFAEFLFVYAIAQTTEVSQYEWKNVRIGGGGYIPGIIFSKAAKNVLYCRTDMGGAYRWDAQNDTWVQMLNFLGHDDFQLSNVESIAADPVDSNRVYLACGQEIWAGAQRAIFRSTDKGVTFTKIIPPFNMGGNYNGRGNGERLQVDPNKNSILFMATRTKGLYKSLDYGTTWNSVGDLGIKTTSNNCGLNIVLIDPKSATAGNPSQVIYLGVSQVNTNIYISTNGGENFTALVGQPNSATLMPHRMAMGADSCLYITFCDNEGPNGIGAGKVWKYYPPKGTWTDITPTVGSGGGYGGVTVDANIPGVVMVSTICRWSNEEIYRSINGGISWIKTAGSGSKGVRDAKEFPWVRWHNSSPEVGGWADDIEIDPFNPNRVMYSTGGGIYSTDNITNAEANQTINWTFFVRGIEEMGGWGTGKNIVSPTAGAPLFSVFGDIGGFKHHNLDVSPPDSNFYNPIGNSNTSIDVAWLRPSVLVRTNYDTKRGSYTINSGKTWTAFASCPAVALTADEPGYIAISAKATSIVWNPRGNGMYYSKNNGASWAASTGGPVAVEGWNRFIPTADKVIDGKFYTHDAHNGKVYCSIDGGMNWVLAGKAQVPSDPGGWAMQSVPGKEGEIWIPLGNNGLTHSTNSGAAWEKLPNIQKCEHVGFGKAAPNSTYPTIFIYAMIADSWGFYRSDDHADSWVRMNSDEFNLGWISGICGDPNVFKRLYVSTTGRGLFYADNNYDCTGSHNGTAYTDSCGECVEGTTGKIACTPLDAPQILNSSYFSFNPNPFSYSLQLKPTGSIEYKIRSIDGKTVEEGRCSQNCNVGSILLPGIYLLTVSFNDEVKTIRIVKK